MKNLHKMGLLDSEFPVDEKRKRKGSTTTGELLHTHCHSAIRLAEIEIHVLFITFDALRIKPFLSALVPQHQKQIADFQGCRFDGAAGSPLRLPVQTGDHAGRPYQSNRGDCLPNNRQLPELHLRHIKGEARAGAGQLAQQEICYPCHRKVARSIE